ncbi:NitT/TauT family transport system ATP-binding protein [Micromonospora profundi]|uniref:ABC transporter ATP-binding protein n=1 Tax=Micromonospora profundi TaxID=1420889 RepID=UPI00143C4410|nr:ABC transporter ATP-binding protein [Micromonospora profundi]NJC12974.1 NitT/TauT family transport system ATP-binding protein [Micromonospora profundi]
MRPQLTSPANGERPAATAADGTAGVSIGLTGIRHGFAKNGRVVRALWDLDLDIAPGEFVSVVGPSGCGKTTLLTMVAGLDRPRVGAVTVDGKPVTGPSNQVAYMLARDALLPWRTVRGNVEYGLTIRRIDKAERHRRSTEWLDRVGLRDFADARVGELSQGMRQRVAVARTLALQPSILLMDEPFAALDAQNRLIQQQEFLKLWERIRSTVILVTHDLHEAIMLSDRVVLISHRPGRVIADLRIDLPRPRGQEVRHNPLFEKYYDDLYGLLTAEVRAQVTEVEEQR